MDMNGVAVVQGARGDGCVCLVVVVGKNIEREDLST